MEPLPPWAIGACGALIGLAVGFSVKRAKLCTFGAFEDVIAGGDARRMKIFALALGIAMIATQSLIIANIFRPEFIRYLASSVPWLSIIAGSLFFGLGMALVGTCAFGSLVRLGAGDLRSLVSLLVFGAVAYAAMKGALAYLRADYVEAFALGMPGQTLSDLPSILHRAFGVDPRLWISLAAGSSLIAWCLADRRLWRSRRLLLAGFTLGAGVALGWFVTGALSDPMSATVDPQSLTFVAPVAKTLYAFMLGNHAITDFGLAAVLGVVMGAFLAARLFDEFRWEAFDDHHEMRRHIVGAACMGFGGVLAGGCTIGQGLSAGSVLALSWPLALAGMAIGARVGIAVLVEGSARDLLSRLFLIPFKTLKP